MSLGRRAACLVAACIGLASLAPAVAYACSPPFEEPTIRALGPTQVVIVGRIGERVAGGRQFHVERWFNGGAPVTPIVIAFKEGEALGDCSYPITTGASLIIAPYREPDGRLSADLTTLQADPASEQGRKYSVEAVGLFGPGVVPPAPAEPPEVGQPPWILILVGLIAAGALLARWQGWTIRDHD